MKLKTNLKIVSGQLDIAAMVDVVFLLLLFFMLSSSLVFQPGISVELPKSHTSSMSAAEKIIITITRKDGGELLFFNDNPVAWTELEHQLTELAYSSKTLDATRRGEAKNTSSTANAGVAGPTPKVVLRADKNVAYGRIVEVMSLARSLDLGVYLATDAPGKESLSMSPVPRQRVTE